MIDAIEEVLISQDAIEKKVAELGQTLSQEYAGRKPLLVGILKGACPYFMNIIRHMPIPLEIDFEDYAYQLQGGLKATCLLTQAVLPSMMANSSGSIINMVSNLVADPVVPYTDYIAAKASIVGYTKSMAKDLGSMGIRMNAIAPGLVYPTDSTYVTKELLKEKLIASTALKRIVQVEDIVGPALFLASDWSKMMTGQVLYVDGGLVMQD